MKVLFTVVLCLISMISIVFPNANPELLAGLLVCGGCISMLYTRNVSPIFVGIFLSIWIITIFYLLIGSVRDAPTEAITQTLAIYIVFPFLWVLIIHLAYRFFGVNRIVAALGVLTFLAALSVAAYFYLVLNFGPSAVWFYSTEEANVHITQGYAGATLHVSGSLIFLSAAFAAEPKVIRSLFYRVALFFPLTLAVFSAGRSMAILALFFGILISAISGRSNILLRVVYGTAILLVISPILIFAMELLLDVNLVELVSAHFEKIGSTDDERPLQMAALFDGASKFWFIGAGHGLGVEYLRSSDFPWRYEVVWFALLYKVGFMGVLVILFPFLYALLIFLKLYLTHSLQKYDMFFGSTLMIVLFASLTNPYIEAFSFQWMYILPLYHFFWRNFSMNAL